MIRFERCRVGFDVQRFAVCLVFGIPVAIYERASKRVRRWFPTCWVAGRGQIQA